MSLASLLSVTLEIEFRGKRGIGMRTMGAEMEGEFDQIIAKQGQQQVTADYVSLTFIWYFLKILGSYFYPIQTL